MAVPDYQSLMRPVLGVVERHGVVAMRDLYRHLADDLGLTPGDLAETVTSGIGLLPSRAGWAVTYLVKAGALERPRRGHVQLTDRGRDLLAAGHPVGNADLARFAEYREFMARSGRATAEHRRATAGSSIVVETPEPVVETPDDLITRAEAQLRAATADELLARARALEPEQFEKLVLALLQAMGYGTSGVVEHAGRSGDAGIDGIISQDPLGLDRIYVQAKRYAEDNVVHRPAVQGFVGALMGAQGDRGVFLTTSSFSSGALAEAERVNARLELIDGVRLAEPMIEFGVGVQTQRTITLRRIDEDYFELL